MAGVPGQGFQPGRAAAPCSQVEISVACRNLRDKDAFSKSDPICVLFTYDIKSKRFYEFGRTEMIKDTLNPDFVHKFVMNYYFEESQKLKFELYDVDSATSALSAHDFLGRMECTLGEIVGCGGGCIEKQLSGLQGKSFITVRAAEVSSSKEVVTLHLRASGLDKKDFLGKSDPFLIFYRANNDGSYTVVHKTEVIKNTLNPTWKPFTIPAKTFCSGDHERLIKIECFDWDSDGSSHDLIGEFTTTLKDLIKAPQANTVYQVINPKKKAKKRNYKDSGELMVMVCKVETVPSFLDYLHGGLELNFTVAIDFTASNGNPMQPSSLHYYNPNQLNQYAAAIQAVGEIIQDYDTDKLFPVLGFGAKLPDGNVSFEFPCNFNPTNPYCQGLQGIMQAYYTALQRVQLYGPTNFSPIINHVSKFASAKKDGSNYFVLLIITDGVISDMGDTMNAIINASQLPVSIIIVGVGDAEFDGKLAEFDAMDQLDADGQRLRVGHRVAERDIVQFVPFREFMGRGDVGMSQAALAKAVLAEVPDQVIYYMKKAGVKPNPNPLRKPAAAVPPAGQLGPVGGQGGYQPKGSSAPGAPPYPGSNNVPLYPQTGAPGQPPYNQTGAPAGNAPPYPQGGAPGQPPYPQGGPGQPPYPQGGPGRGAAPPYPAGSGAAGGGTPYLNQQGPPGSAPYPTGGNAPYSTDGTSSYSQGHSGNTLYPQGQGQAGGTAPYPQGGPGSAPYPQGGNTPYPQGHQAGGGAQQTPPYPQGPPGSAPYQGQGGNPPYPQGQPPYPSQGRGVNSQGQAPPGRPPPPRNTTI